MPEQRVERKLVAILAADVAGYSRLIGLDEEGTLARLKTLRREVIDPEIASHRGRIVKTTGDGLLIEFASVVDAVRCAVAAQRACVEREAALPHDRRIEFRIGVNLGDIVVEGDDILGDGVNVAARLEGIAEPGGICISEDAFRQVQGRVEVEFHDLGDQQLKNITRPIRAYSLLSQKSGSTPLPALPLPDKPSIAVLPFQNMSGDPEQEYFADGMVEEITTAIARLPWLFVIARNSSFTYKGKAIDVKQVASELGVRYVLEGSVRKAGQRVRITGQLIDTSTGAHIWADRFDGALDNIFDLQDRVAASVVGAIEPRLRFSEIQRSSRKPTSSQSAYDLYLRSLAQLYSYTEESVPAAYLLLRQALTLDRNYVPAAALMGWCYILQQVQGWGSLSNDDSLESIHLARQVVEAGRDDAEAIAQAAFTLYYLAGEVSTAASVLQRASSLNPNSALTWEIKGWIHALRNEPEAALDALDRALRLSPFDPLGHIYATGFAIAYISARRFEQAVEWADRALQHQPRYVIAMRAKIIANAHLGHLDEARRDLYRMIAIYPGSTIAQTLARSSAFAPELLDLYVAGLRKAGMPEQ
jgi:TolB-like protein/tetratricopeptide (TPR) repeat protein